jgi:zinc protease
MTIPQLPRASLAGALGVLLAVASAARSQDVDRAGRPAVPPPPTFKFPKLQSHTLPNGIRLLVVEDRSLPLVAVRAVFAVDSSADPVGKQGLYAVTMAALRDATMSKTADQLAEEIADLGANVLPTAFTTTSPEFARALGLMGDMVMHPRFDQEAINRLKANRAATVRTMAQNPSILPRRIFFSVLYGVGDPAMRVFASSDSDVASITRDDVVGFYHEHVGPGTMTLVIVGDVLDRDAVAEAGRVFGGWQNSASAANVASTPAALAGGSIPAARSTAIYLHDVPGTQAFVYLGAAGPVRGGADQYVVETMGGLVNARMQQVLREQKSFMYSGSAAVLWFRNARPSPFFGATSVDATKIDSALVAWLGLLRGLRADKPVTPDELEAIRRNSVGVLPARIDGPDALAARVAELARDRLPLDYFDRYAAGMSTVSAADVAATASRYIDLDHLVIVVTGDRKVIEPALRAANIAPVVVVDQNGKN